MQSNSVRDSWAYRELARIEALTLADVVYEVHNAMNGYNYSWKAIQRELRDLDINYALYLEWDGLCRMKRTWESFPSLTRERQRKDVVTSLLSNSKALDSMFLKVLLVNLRLILIRAGLEEKKAIQLVTANIDNSPRFDLEDLWVDCEKWGLHFLDKDWVVDRVVDEEAPLLPRAQGYHKSIWSWRSWFPLSK